MNQITPPPKIEIIPSSAPFSEAQRSWLNGFFAGLLSEAATPLSAEQGAAVMQGPAGDGDDGEAPWHDQTIPIADRMKLADGRPLRRRMMAAMAQQDCGQCGYNCHDYSEAIATKAEGRLNLCVPGGKETARMLKTLYEDLDKASAPGAASAPAAAAPTPIGELGRSRDNPAPATFLSRRLLNKDGSEKETWHSSTRMARKRKPGTSSSIFPAAASTMRLGIPSAFSPATNLAMSIRSSRCSVRPTRPPCGGVRYAKS
jgi:sulfite reductase (NADPH) flavoprotein alpha-component